MSQPASECSRQEGRQSRGMALSSEGRQSQEEHAAALGPHTVLGSNCLTRGSRQWTAVVDYGIIFCGDSARGLKAMLQQMIVSDCSERALLLLMYASSVTSRALMAGLL